MTARSWQRWSGAIAAVVAVMAGLTLLAPHLSLPPMAAYVLGFAMVVASVLGVALVTPSEKGRRGLAPALPALALLLLVHLSKTTGTPAALAVAAALLAVGTALGAVVGAGIEHPGHLVFVVIVSSLADVFSVTQPEGPSAAIVNAPQALGLLAISWPMLGTDQLAPLLGVGDIVFTGLYLAAARAHGLPLGRTLIALALAFVATMVTVIVTELPVPALPFLGVAMLLAHPAARRPPQRDRAKAVAVVFALSLLFVALLARRFL
jgi:hypothetical protein